MTTSADSFKAGMRQLAAGVSVITTTAGDGTRLGITATAVCSLTAEPPSLMVAVNTATGTGAVIAATGRLCVNVLARSHEDVARVFAGMTGINGPERFDTGTWTTESTGAPVLADALAAFDCTVVKTVDHGTHTVFISEVQAVRVNATSPDPLVYANSAFTGVESPASQAA